MFEQSKNFSKLVGLSILNEDDVAHDFDIIFMQTSQDLETINSAVGCNSKWSNVLAKSAGETLSSAR